MPCFTPLKGWRARKPSKNGRFGIVFDISQSNYQEMTVPCGQCIGCRIDRSRDWAIRCMHEASMHEESCFLTLTYRPEDLPVDGSLDKSHFQKFMKRLRKSIAPKKVRFFHCGEYGENLSRPHYHALLFGHSFVDQTLLTIRNGNRYYTSRTLDNLWGLGYSMLGNVTFESAAYVARYITKKVTGADAADYYWRDDPLTGVCWRVEPEYCTMSRRPGIGGKFYEENFSDIFPHDFCVHPSKYVEVKTPRYYSNLLEADDPELFESLLKKRKQRQKKYAKDCTDERLAVRHKCKVLQVEKLIRPIEDINYDYQALHSI